MIHNVVLIGPMGAGKTTIGRQLANKLGFDFLDTDHMVEARTGADIPWIFDVEGEEGFRTRETLALQEALSQSRAVIATGGGIVMRDENRQALKQAGMVVYLSANVEQLIERTYKDKKRPLLQVPNPQQRIREIFELRDPIYREVADEIVSTDGSHSRRLVQRIAAIINA